jgi:hypothetical protein
MGMWFKTEVRWPHGSVFGYGGAELCPYIDASADNRAPVLFSARGITGTPVKVQVDLERWPRPRPTVNASGSHEARVLQIRN